MIIPVYIVSVVFHEDSVNYFSTEYARKVRHAKCGARKEDSFLSEEGFIAESAEFLCRQKAERCERLLQEIPFCEDYL